MSQTELEARTIDGRYTVEGTLGRGGMGVVFRARHRFTGAAVAIKVLHPHIRAQGYDAQRFLAEARAPGAIGHPGIARVLDAGQTPEGELYLVLELLEGESLRAAAARGLRPADVQRIGLEVLGAIGAAHAAGFVHRDLKPENLFITTGGAVKVLDFGIAKVLVPAIATPQTAMGVRLGTPAYMAPEQYAGGAIDARTDLWTIGVILDELLGRDRPPIAPAVEAFFARALANDPAQRFQSAEQMAAALRPLPLGPPAPEGTAGTAQFVLPYAGPPPTPARSRRPLIIAAGVAALGAVIVAATLAGPDGGDAPADVALAVDASTVDASAVDAAAVDAAAIVVPIDAGPRVPPATATPRATSAEVCAAGCAMLAGCGLGDPQCVAGCLRDANAVACMRTSTTCVAFATCALGRACGGRRPRGAMACAAAAQCEGACAGDHGCICGCVAATRPASAVALFGLNLCALVRCPTGGPACVERSCRAQAARCAVE